MDQLVLDHVSYSYDRRKSRMILSDVSVTFSPGTISSIRGHSGAGKSTLLYLISGLETPTEGEIRYNGIPVKKKDLVEYRRKTVSLIAQNYLLFPNKTALENVCFPLKLDGIRKPDAEKEAKDHLRSVNLGDELFGRLPSRLSGGEQQRVAIARCLACHTPIIAADEPTGSLDEQNAEEVLTILKALAKQQNKTIILVTHDRSIAEEATIQYVLNNGKLNRQGE